MKLKRGDVYIKNNFLPKPLIYEIRSYSKENKPDGVNLTEWRQEVVDTSGAIILYRLPVKLVSRIAAHVHTIFPKTSTLIPRVTYTLGCRYSYIPWHKDDHHEFTVTVYLNDYWDREWAGALIYKSGDEYKAVYPEFNKAICFAPPLDHCTIMPNIRAPIRESLQIFFR